MSLEKTGAEALDEIVLGMTASPVDRIHKLLAEGRNKEASLLVERLSVTEINKLAQDLEVQVSQSEDEVAPPASEVSEEHDVEENTSKGKPHGGEPSNEEAEINVVEGEGGSEEATRAPTQLEEEAEPPKTKKAAIIQAYLLGAQSRADKIKEELQKGEE